MRLKKFTQPELLSGTVRYNLDPFEEYDDSTLYDALRSAGLYSLQNEGEDEGQLTLDSTISGGGANLSLGQRQILALGASRIWRNEVCIDQLQLGRSCVAASSSSWTKVRYY
jgi:ABC-type multidrug transport system fused ATPase/permease subunit